MRACAQAAARGKPSLTWSTVLSPCWDCPGCVESAAPLMGCTRHRAAGAATEDEQGEVDIGASSGCTPQPVPAAAAASPWAGPPLLHLPLQLQPLEDDAPQQAAAAGGGEQLKGMELQQGEDGQQRMDVG